MEKKQQYLGLLRAWLLAVGSLLTSFGLASESIWMPVLGILLAAYSVGWGLLYHKDPANPGKLSWSLVRKLVNAISMAIAGWGLAKPDQVESINLFFTTLGPIIAMKYSWVANGPTEDPEDPDFKPPFNLLLLLLALSILLPSCQGLTLRARSPYANGVYKDGQLYIIPKARVTRIPILDQK